MRIFKRKQTQTQPQEAPHPQREVIIANADKIEELIQRLDHLAPCANPECIEFRDDMKQIVANTKQVHG